MHFRFELAALFNAGHAGCVAYIGFTVRCNEVLATGFLALPLAPGCHLRTGLPEAPDPAHFFLRRPADHSLYDYEAKHSRRKYNLACRRVQDSRPRPLFGQDRGYLFFGQDVLHFCFILSNKGYTLATIHV